MPQQPTFDPQWIAGQRAGVAAQPLPPHYPMAGNEDRDRIIAAGAADGASGGIEFLRQLAIGQHGSRWNGLQRCPGPLLERSPARRQRNRKLIARITEIRFQLCDHSGGRDIRRWLFGRIGSQVIERTHGIARHANADSTQRCGHHGLIHTHENPLTLSPSPRKQGELYQSSRGT